MTRRRKGASLKRRAALILSTFLWSTLLVAVGGRSVAATNPPYEPDAQTQGACAPATSNCTLRFYDATGNPVTGGDINALPFAAYAQADQPALSATDNHALLQIATPVIGVKSTDWQNGPLSPSRAYPVAGIPASLSNARPTVDLSTHIGNRTLNSWIKNNPNSDTSADGYQGLYQIRMTTFPSQTPNYYSADILVVGTSWTLLYPTFTGTPASQTTVTLTASPLSAPSGTPVILTATVTPVTATGTVQFMDGASALGSTMTVAAGVATFTQPSFSIGSHVLVANFQPSDTTKFQPSASSPVALDASGPVAAQVVLSTSPVATAPPGTAVVLKATMTPVTATGAVQFVDGSSNIGGPATISGGVASTTTSAMGLGPHSLTAVYTPANPALFAAATSAATSYRIAAPAVATTSSLVVTPSGPVVAGSPVTLTVTLAPPGAVGAVQFLADGATLGGLVALGSGTAQVSTTALSAGTHSLSANFVPTDATAFVASTAPGVSLTVAAGPSVTATDSAGQVIQAGSTLVPGVSITLSGSRFAPGETTTVTVQSSPTVLTSGQVVDPQGNVTATVGLPTGLASGSHTLTLAGASGDSAAFAFQVGTGVTTTGNGGVTGTSTGSTSTKLPVTGFHDMGWVSFGVWLLLWGLLLEVCSHAPRNRRAGQST